MSPSAEEGNRKAESKLWSWSRGGWTWSCDIIVSFPEHCTWRAVFWEQAVLVVNLHGRFLIEALII